MSLIRKGLGRIRRSLMSSYWRHKLSSFGDNSVIINPLKIGGGISVGDDVRIAYKCWIEANPLAGADTAEIDIRDGCRIGNFNEIYATKSIILEKDVLTADRVYISDNLHGYEDPDVSIWRQPIKQNGDEVRIGEGSWLGVGVAVVGASIGRHCVIGANAVVTHDIPDYSVAVGIPARVIKRYNPETGRWEETNPDGSFR